MKYVKATINYNNNGGFIFSDFVDSDGDRLRVTDKTRNEQILAEFAKQQNLSLIELLNRNDLIERKTRGRGESNQTNYSPATYEKENENNEKKSKVKKWIKRLLATVTAFVIAATGAYHLDKNKKIFGGKIYAIFHPNQKIETSVGDNSSIDTNYSEVDASDNDNVSNKENDSSKENQPSDNYQIISMLATQSFTSLSDDEILDALNDNLRRANANLYEVSKYINGNSFDVTPEYDDSYKLFINGTDEYFVIKVFSDMRNEIVKSAYSSEKPTKVQEMINEYCEMYKDFVVLGNGRTFELSGERKRINYNELSTFAKLAIVQFGDALAVYADDFDQEIFDFNEVELNKLLTFILGNSNKKQK